MCLLVSVGGNRWLFAYRIGGEALESCDDFCQDVIPAIFFKTDHKIAVF